MPTLQGDKVLAVPLQGERAVTVALAGEVDIFVIGVVVVSYLLTEAGDFLTTEAGDRLILE